MKSNSIEKILSDPQFIKELDRAIDSGKSMDYGYDHIRDEETSEQVFETDTARNEIVQLLKKYLIQK